MRIVQITPGSGDNFYCENCLRDIALVKALRKLGHDVLMVPLYLPLQADETEPLTNTPIFFGGDQRLPPAEAALVPQDAAVDRPPGSTRADCSPGPAARRA